MTFIYSESESVLLQKGNLYLKFFLLENTRNLVEFLQELLSCVSSWYLSDNLAYNVEQQALELVSP